MSRQRFIHPCIFQSEDFLALSHGARLLFVGMFTLADDEGRGYGSPRSLAGSVFPGEPVDVGPWLEEVVSRGLARVYVAKSGTYYDLPTWRKWQRPKYVIESRIPPYERSKSFNFNDQPKVGPKWDQSGDTGRVGLGREEKESLLTIPRTGDREPVENSGAPPHTPVTDSLPDSKSKNDEAPTSPPEYLRDVPAMQLCQAAAKTLEAQLETRGAHKLRSRVLHEIRFLGVDQATNRPMLDCPGDLHAELLVWFGAQGLTRQLEEIARRLVRRSNGTASQEKPAPQEKTPPGDPPPPEDLETDFPTLQETAP
jgi:hypothetical protein